MPRRKAPLDLEPYQALLHKWLPKAQLRAPVKGFAQFDGVLTFNAGQGATRYLVEEKRHLRFQDVGVIADQMLRRRAAIPGHAKDALLLLAPHVRAQHAAALERAGIDYVDLVGNAHLEAPGLLVHVEGRQPPKEARRAPGRPQKGWIKTVMALLLEPELANAPYRTIAAQADVALGTLAACMHDLTQRGLLLDRRDGRTITDRVALVALWVTAYVEGLRPKLKERRFQVRVDDKQQLAARIGEVLARGGDRWALTGADAAERRTHFFRAEDTEIYAPIRVFEDRDTQRALVAQPTGRGGNLLVIDPPGPLTVAAPAGGELPVAPDLLAYAELRYRGTEPALEAAGLLLPWVVGEATD